MKNIARFYTWFWIIYFPVCIAFTEVVNVDFSDELLTILLLLYAFFHQRWVIKEKKRKKEIWVCIIMMLLYLIYSLSIHVTSTRGVWLDFFQQIRPYAIFYLTWVMAPDFSHRQKKVIVSVMLLSFAGYLVAYIFNPTLVTPYVYREMAITDRESMALGQLALCCSMVYFLFTKPTKYNRNIAILIMLIGLLSGKSKYFGECIAFVALVVFLKNKIKFDSVKSYFSLLGLGFVILFFTWTKFNMYYVEGMMSQDRDRARPETYKVGAQIMIDYFPFGSGFGTFGCAAAAKEYSPLYYKYHLDGIWGLEPENPMFLADTFYPIVYSEFGIFGVFLFMWFWIRRIRETNKIDDIRQYKMALMCILALGLESTADSSYLSGKGMGYFMILAVCLNSNLIAIRLKKIRERAQVKAINNIQK